MKGLIIVMPLFYLYPSHADLILLSAIVGFNIPDLDLFVGTHRKTIHYPIRSFLIFPILGLLFLITNSAILLSLTIISLGIWIHSISDIFGGSLEDAPWQKTTDIVVYNHHHSNWIDARRYVEYDGSPEDLLLFTTLTVAFILMYPLELSHIGTVSLTAISVIAVIYTIFRRTLFSPIYMEENYPKLKELSDRMRGD